MRQYPKIFFVMSLLGAWTFSSQCRSMDNNMHITINRSIPLDSLPSGSGLEVTGDSMYIISDNAPAYYKMDLRTMKYEHFPIKGFTGNGYIIPKKNKHDLEGSVIGKVNGEEYLMAFGSGSSPRREMLLLIDIHHKKEDRKIPLARLYNALRTKYDLSNEALNIEGAAVCNKKLYLFLRKKNMIISMRWADFEQYILNPGEGAIPATGSQYLMLPKHSGVSAGFSGATEVRYKGKEAIMFCASLEHTPNAIDDGPVFGSYIGVMTPQENGQMEIEALDIIRNKDGNILKEKIESLAVINYDTTTYKTLIISDNDDGRSSIFEADISIK
jgi:hypothetical protein